jgi:hypothetical protein
MMSRIMPISHGDGCQDAGRNGDRNSLAEPPTDVVRNRVAGITGKRPDCDNVQRLADDE